MEEEKPVLHVTVRDASETVIIGGPAPQEPETAVPAAEPEGE